MNEETRKLLESMNQKMDTANQKLDRISASAAKTGALAGLASGSVAGGIVAAGILIVRAKLGL